MSTLFFDIDNTLLSHKTFTIPESALCGLRKAKQNGHRLFIASGRCYDATRLYMDPEIFDGAVTSSGSCGWLKEELLFEHHFKAEDVRTLVRACDDYGIGLSLHSPRHSFMTEWGIRTFVNRTHRTKKMLDDMGVRNYSPETETDYCKMDLFFDGKDGEPVIAMVPQGITICRTLTVTREVNGCELTPGAITKAAGAMELLGKIGADPSDTYAFGDSENDIEILQAMHTGVAMGNSSREALEAADYVCPDIEEDGIYRALEHFGLI